MNPRRNDELLENDTAAEALPSSLAWETVPRVPMLPVEVHIASYVSSPVVWPDDALEHKRQSIWHNGPRNCALAEIATAITCRDESVCWKYGLFLNDAYSQIVSRLPQPPMLTILVESPEHANVLAELLPGFAVGTEEQGSRRSCTWLALMTGWIMTQVSAHRAYRLKSDVIINAVGGPHAIALQKWEMDVHRATVVIDLLDESDERSRRNTWARMVTYHRMASRVIGADSVFGNDPGERHAIPCKDRQQRLSERSNHVAANRRLQRLDQFRSWRGR